MTQTYSTTPNLQEFSAVRVEEATRNG